MSEADLHKCNRCKSIMQASMFHKNRRYKSGLSDTCKECRKLYRLLPEQKSREKEYQSINRERLNENCKRSHAKESFLVSRRPYLAEYQAEIRKNLKDSYVKQKIARGTKLSFSEIPDSLVQTKRVQLQITRLLKDKK